MFHTITNVMCVRYALVVILLALVGSINCRGIALTPVFSSMSFGGNYSDSDPGFINLTIAVQDGVVFTGGVQQSKMTGPIVGCGTSVATDCIDLDSFNYDLRRSANYLTVLSRNASSGWTTYVVRMPLSRFGMSSAAVTKTFMFSHVGWNAGLSLPTQHASTGSSDLKMASVNFATGAFSLSQKHTNNILIAYLVSLAMLIVLVVVGLILQRCCLTCLASRRAELVSRTLAVLFLLFDLIIVIVLAYLYYNEKGDDTAIFKAFGQAGIVLFGFVLFPISHYCSLPRLLKLSYERTIWIHITIGLLIVVASTIHFAGMVSEDDDGREGFSDDGFICWLATIFTVFPALLIRRWKYVLFRLSHLCFVIAIVFLIVHVPVSGLVMIPGLLCYAIDLAVRIGVLRRNKATVTKIVFYPANSLVELNVDWVGPHHAPTPTQFAQLSIKAIGMIPHPISVASVQTFGEGDVKRLTFFIRTTSQTSWTGALAAIASSDDALNTINCKGVSILSVNGGTQLALDQCEAVVLIAGGVGVTPMVSILNEFATQHLPPRLRRIDLLWTSRHLEDIEMIGKQCADFAQRISMASVGVTVHLKFFFTGSKQEMHQPSVTGGPFEVVDGRPSWTTEMDLLQKSMMEQRVFASLTHCYICGPEAMLWAASEAAEKADFKVHRETFEM